MMDREVQVERPGYGWPSSSTRTDLAIGYLNRVTGPTLLIVGGEDPAVLDMNRRRKGTSNVSTDWR